MKKSILLVCSILFLGNLYAQKIENIDVQLVDGNFILAFDLIPRESINEEYDLHITSSKDNYGADLIITNSSTKNVKPKNRLQYIVSGEKNFTGYKGAIDFQISATLAYSPLRMISPNSSVTVKKGKSMNLQWRGGAADDKFKVDLYKSNIKVSTIQSGFSRKVTTWAIPKNTQKGSDYKIKIESESNSKQSVFTRDFKIKGKTSFIVVLLPIAAIGAAAAVLLGGSSEDPTGGGGTTTDNLPDPPGPPSN